ncbi:MAG TPA: hypothetical protein VFJ43_14695 [Bacteroidia bacterium]|nr:hypothetical protein [Bacteroidia bacterium]
MKKIRMMAVFTVMALAASFAGHAQTTKTTVQKAPASKDQTVAPAKQSKSSTTSTSTTTAKSSTATTHKAHKKPVNATAKPAPAVKSKATVAPSNHFAPRAYSKANYGMMKGKHKKGHHGKKAPTGDGK